MSDSLPNITADTPLILSPPGRPGGYVPFHVLPEAVRRRCMAHLKGLFEKALSDIDKENHSLTDES